MKTVLAMGICLLVVAGCQQGVEQVPQAPVVNKQAIIDELTAAQQAYADAWSNMDMAAISTMWSHDDDITLWGPQERDRVVGWDSPNGVRAWYEAAMEPMAEIDFKIHDLLIKVNDEGNAAVITYYVENDYVDNEGTRGKMTPRVTVVKVKQNGEWKQIHGDASFSINEIQGM